MAKKWGKGSVIKGKYIVAVATGQMTSMDAADEILGNKKPEDNFWLAVGLSYELDELAKEHIEAMKARHGDQYKAALALQVKLHEGD